MGDHYRTALEENEAIIALNVTENLFERHIRPSPLARSTAGRRWHEAIVLAGIGVGFRG